MPDIPEVYILDNLENETNKEKEMKSESIDDFKNKIKLLNGNDRTNCIQILHLNIRSAYKHFDELLIFIQSCDLSNCDIIILGETRLIDQTESFRIPGFSTIFNNSKLNKNDGVLIFINDKINYKVEHKKLPLTNIVISNIEFSINNTAFNVMPCYRSPSTGDNQFIEDLETHLSINDKENVDILIGDFNIDILNNESAASNNYLAMLMSFGFKSYINTYTRITPNSRSCLDHIFIRHNLNDKKIKFNSSIINYNTTDHLPIFLHITSNENYVTKLTKITKEITKFNEDKFMELIKDIKWEEVILIQEPQKAWTQFMNAFNNTYKECTTIKTITIKEHKKLKPWITNAIVESIENRDKLKKT